MKIYSGDCSCIHTIIMIVYNPIVVDLLFSSLVQFFKDDTDTFEVIKCFKFDTCKNCLKSIDSFYDASELVTVGAKRRVNLISQRMYGVGNFGIDYVTQILCCDCKMIAKWAIKYRKWNLKMNVSVNGKEIKEEEEEEKMMTKRIAHKSRHCTWNRSFERFSFLLLFREFSFSNTNETTYCPDKVRCAWKIFSLKVITFYNLFTHRSQSSFQQFNGLN